MSSINFVLEGLNNTLDLTLLADLENTDDIYSDIIADTTATIDVKLTDMKKLFRFTTDSSDIDNLDANDTRYYVKMNNYPTNLILNPAHAIITDETNEYGTEFAIERSMVKHDFTRYLADKLFGTHKAVDLFTNEDNIKFDIAEKGYEISWKHIYDSLNAAKISELEPYYTNANTDASNNFTKKILTQIINQHPERLSNIDSIMNNEFFSVPFKSGDAISFKTTIYPNQEQHNLTGISTVIPPRNYEIKLVIKDDINVNYVKPTDAMPYIQRTNYNNAYPYHAVGEFQEFRMPNITGFDVSNIDNVLVFAIEADTFNLTSLRISAFDDNGDVLSNIENVIDDNGDVLSNIENVIIDISDKNSPAILSILDANDGNNGPSKTLETYENENGIHTYRVEFVTNDNLNGAAFKTYTFGNSSNNYNFITSS